MGFDDESLGDETIYYSTIGDIVDGNSDRLRSVTMPKPLVWKIDNYCDLVREINRLNSENDKNKFAQEIYSTLLNSFSDDFIRNYFTKINFYEFSHSIISRTRSKDNYIKLLKLLDKDINFQYYVLSSLVHYYDENIPDDEYFSTLYSMLDSKGLLTRELIRQMELVHYREKFNIVLKKADKNYIRIEKSNRNNVVYE